MKHSAPLLAISLTACATTHPALAVPTRHDVQEYVAANWQYYQNDVRRAAAGYAGRLELVGVSELKCGGRGMTMCDFQITAKTEAGDLVSVRKSELLGYGDDGKLGEFIIVG
jgi:hypothetical protein